MKAEDVKVGMKVVPNKPCINRTWEEMGKYEVGKQLKEKGFLTVGENRSTNPALKSTYELNADCHDHYGKSGHWYASDFEPAVIEVGDVVRPKCSSEENRRDHIIHAERNGAFILNHIHRGGDHIRCVTWTADELDLVRKAKKPEQKPEQNEEGQKPATPDAFVRVFYAIDSFHANQMLVTAPIGRKIDIGAKILCKAGSVMRKATAKTSAFDVTRESIEFLAKKVGQTAQCVPVAVGEYTETETIWEA